MSSATADGNAKRSDTSRERSRTLDRVLVAVCLLTLAVLAGLLCTFGYGRDQGIYAIVGRAIVDGGMPYRDAFDFKPPGVFLVYAAARVLFGSAQYGVRVLEAVGMLATVWAMTWLTRRHAGDWRIGLVGGTLFALLHVQLDFWHTGQPESFGGMLTILGLCCASKAWLGGTTQATAAVDDNDDAKQPVRGRTSAAWLLASGVALGIAGLMKPPLAGGGAMIGLAFAIAAYRSERGPWLHRLRASLRPLVLVGLGGIAPIAACVGWFAATGALDHLHEVLFVFTPPYTKLSWQGQSAWTMTYIGLRDFLMRYSMLMLAGYVLLLAFRPNRELRPLVGLIGAILGIQLAGVVLQGKFFQYHYGAAWPLAGLLAGWGWYHLWTWTKQRGPLAIAATVIAVIVCSQLRSATTDVYGSFSSRSATRLSLYVFGEFDQVKADGLATVADVDAVENRYAANAVAKLTPPGSPIFVWGFEPVIYDLADRPSPTRFIYNVPQRVSWVRPEHRAELLDSLRADPPAAVVVEHGDVFPWVTGNDYDSNAAMWAWPELREWLMSNYALTVAGETDFDIYVVRTDEGADASDVR